MMRRQKLTAGLFGGSRRLPLSGTTAGRARLENVEPLKKDRRPTLLN
jgi:hypothetical protein